MAEADGLTFTEDWNSAEKPNLLAVHGKDGIRMPYCNRQEIKPKRKT